MNIILPDDCFEVFLAPGITFDHLPLCKSTSVLGASRTQYLSLAGLSSLQRIQNTKHFLKCFSLPSLPLLFTRFNLAQWLLQFWQPGVREQAFSLHPSWVEPKILVFTSHSTLVFLFVSERCLSLMHWSSALFCCHLAKRRKVYRCVFYWENCVCDEREKRSRSFSPLGLSSWVLALAPLFWQLKWIKGEEKNPSVCFVSKADEQLYEFNN